MAGNKKDRAYFISAGADKFKTDDQPTQQTFEDLTASALFFTDNPAQESTGIAATEIANVGYVVINPGTIASDYVQAEITDYPNVQVFKAVVPSQIRIFTTYTAWAIMDNTNSFTAAATVGVGAGVCGVPKYRIATERDAAGTIISQRVEFKGSIKYTYSKADGTAGFDLFVSYPDAIKPATTAKRGIVNCISNFCPYYTGFIQFVNATKRIGIYWAPETQTDPQFLTDGNLIEISLDGFYYFIEA